jgi:hypothetical protein
VGLSTRRINQIQLDMRRGLNIWTDFVEHNMGKIVKELRAFWSDQHSLYVFDWTTHRQKILDSEQHMGLATHGASVEEEIMYQEVAGARICTVDPDFLTEAKTRQLINQASLDEGSGTGGVQPGFNVDPADIPAEDNSGRVVNAVFSDGNSHPPVPNTNLHPPAPSPYAVTSRIGQFDSWHYW